MSPSLVSPLAGLYGLLFGFTFSVVQFYFKDFPSWMIKNVLKNYHFVIFNILYVTSLIIYPLIYLLPAYHPYIEISKFLINTLFPILFIVDVLYTIKYFQGMLSMLHPDYLGKLIGEQIKEGRKREGCLTNAYRGVISLFVKYHADKSITDRIEKAIEVTCKAIKKDDEFENYYNKIIHFFISPLQEELIIGGKPDELYWLCNIEKELGQFMVQSKKLNPLHKTLYLLEELFTLVNKSDFNNKVYIKRYIVTCCKKIRKVENITPEQMIEVDSSIARIENISKSA